MEALTILQEKILQNLREIPDYPQQGVLFRDITTILSHAQVFGSLIDFWKHHYKERGFTHIAGIESRGFIFGATLAYALGIGFVPIRKKGKLPYKTYEQEYSLEYGTNILEIHIDAFDNKPAKVLLVDDLLATGGTARASIELIKKAGGKCEEACFLINLKDFDNQIGINTFSILDI